MNSENSSRRAPRSAQHVCSACRPLLPARTPPHGLLHTAGHPPHHAEIQSLRQQVDAAAARADAAEGRLEALQEANERFVEERKVRPFSQPCCVPGEQGVMVVGGSGLPPLKQRRFSRQQMSSLVARHLRALASGRQWQSEGASALQNLQASEGQLLQTLRREIETAEQRLDEERAAHAATRKAAGTSKSP